MKKSIMLACFVMFISNVMTSQSISLIQDVHVGTTGSIVGESVEFKGNVYYIGYQQGEAGIQLFKYNAITNAVYSISEVLTSNQLSSFLATTDDRLYLADRDILYYLDDSSEDLIKFAELSNNKKIESLHTKDDVLVAIADVSFGGEGTAYVIKDDMSNWTKITPVDIDEELTVDIGNDYISTRVVGSSADFTVGNYLVEKATLNVVDPFTVLESTACTQVVNMVTIDDYIFYDCTDNLRYAYNTQDKTHTEISGFVRNVRDGDSHIFITAGFFFLTDLYSFNKTTKEETYIADNIWHIGMLDEAEETLYFLRDADFLYSSKGEQGDLISYEIPGSVGNFPEITGVQTFDDITLVNYDQNSSDFWSLKIEDGQVTPLVDFSNNFDSGLMPFFKVENNLIFSYNDPTYGAELFAAEFMPSSTEDIDQQALSVYPNPATDMITISEYNDGDIIEISDLSGRLIFKSEDSKETIDISSFDSGVYVLSLKNKKQLSRTTIIKL